MVREFLKQLGGYDMIYFGDTARTPYGSKSPETVAAYACQDTDFLISKGARIIVIACNTVSSVATESIKAKYNIPVFEVITPAVELAVRMSNKYRFGVIGTRATINSGIYEYKIKQINADAKVYSAACPLLVPLVEEGWFKKRETAMIVKQYLQPLKVRQIDTLILGCTHYPLLNNIIQRKIGQRVKIIDSSAAVTEKVKNYLETHLEIDKMLSRRGQTKLFVSDVTDQFKKTAMAVLKKKVSLEHAKI